jgi:hypothetical protein
MEINNQQAKCSNSNCQIRQAVSSISSRCFTCKLPSINHSVTWLLNNCEGLRMSTAAGRFVGQSDRHHMILGASLKLFVVCIVHASTVTTHTQSLVDESVLQRSWPCTSQDQHNLPQHARETAKSAPNAQSSRAHTLHYSARLR